MQREHAIDKERWQSMVDHTQPLSVSILMPTHCGTADSRQDPIRLRNLLDRAEQQMIQLGMRAPEAIECLRPARALLEDSDFWRHQGQGLAIFLADGFFQTLRLPTGPREIVTVADHFHLKPLFSLQADDRFFILAVSKKAVQLYAASRYAIEPVPLRNAPKSFKDLTQFDQLERGVKFHSGERRGGAAGARGGFLSAQGDVADDDLDKKRVLEYCHLVDQAVKEALHSDKAPLYLAAADPIAGAYRQVNTAAQLDPIRLVGCPDTLKPRELHRFVLEQIAPRFEAPMRRAIHRYEQALGTGLGTNDLEAFFNAAIMGAVESLIVDGDATTWGRWEPIRQKLAVHETQRAGDEDLLNLAAIVARRNGAEVHVTNRTQLSSDTGVAAVFRFAPARQTADMARDGASG